MRDQTSRLRACALVCLALIGFPRGAEAKTDSLAQSVRPELRWRVDAPLFATGAALYAVGSNLNITHKLVPPEGLDPSDVGWSVDRRVIGQRSTHADTQSDYYRDAALVYPILLAFVSEPSDTRVSGTLQRSVLYAEAVLIAEGLSTIIKGATDRPRPFNYLPVGQRPDTPPYDVTADDAFRSMPSGHAISTFCAAGFAITDHLISRPDANWKERAGSAFVGGFLAGTTSGLRVEGGQHFPSDIIVGGLLGTATGVAVPLVHHYVSRTGRRAPLPSWRAWKQAILGEAIGITAGILVAKTY